MLADLAAFLWPALYQDLTLALRHLGRNNRLWVTAWVPAALELASVALRWLLKGRDRVIMLRHCPLCVLKGRLAGVLVIVLLVQGGAFIAFLHHFILSNEVICYTWVDVGDEELGRASMSVTFACLIPAEHLLWLLEWYGRAELIWVRILYHATLLMMAYPPIALLKQVHLGKTLLLPWLALIICLYILSQAMLMIKQRSQIGLYFCVTRVHDRSVVWALPLMEARKFGWGKCANLVAFTLSHDHSTADEVS